MHGQQNIKKKFTAFSSVLPASILSNFTLLRCFVTCEEKVIEKDGRSSSFIDNLQIPEVFILNMIFF